MVFPFSSCSIERIFSQCTDIKTIKRNKLGISNLEACLMIKQEFGDSFIDLPPHIIEKFSQQHDPLPAMTHPDDIPSLNNMQNAAQSRMEEEIEQKEDDLLIPSSLQAQTSMNIENIEQFTNLI